MRNRTEIFADIAKVAGASKEAIIDVALDRIAELQAKVERLKGVIKEAYAEADLAKRYEASLRRERDQLKSRQDSMRHAANENNKIFWHGEAMRLQAENAILKGWKKSAVSIMQEWLDDYGSTNVISAVTRMAIRPLRSTQYSEHSYGHRGGTMPVTAAGTGSTDKEGGKQS